MEENLIEKYHQELKNKESALISVEKDLKQLQETKMVTSEQEYEKYFKEDMQKVSDYYDYLINRKKDLENIINAYNEVLKYQDQIESIENIQTSSWEVENDKKKDISRLQTLIEEQMQFLPNELQEELKQSKEKTQTNSEEKRVEKNNEQYKTIEQYKEEITRNEQELEHLDEELKELEKAKTEMPETSYQKEMTSLENNRNKEMHELLKNRQIVNSYEIVLNNQKRLTQLASIIIRDEQDAKEMEQEVQSLQSEIEENQKLLPKEIIDSLEQELQKENNQTRKETEQKMSKEQLLANLSKEYSAVQDQIQKYIEKNGQTESEELGKLLSEAERINNLIYMKGGINDIPLEDLKNPKKVEENISDNEKLNSQKFDDIIKKINELGRTTEKQKASTTPNFTMEDSTQNASKDSKNKEEKTESEKELDNLVKKHSAVQDQIQEYIEKNGQTESEELEKLLNEEKDLRNLIDEKKKSNPIFLGTEAKEATIKDENTSKDSENKEEKTESEKEFDNLVKKHSAVQDQIREYIEKNGQTESEELEKLLNEEKDLRNLIAEKKKSNPISLGTEAKEENTSKEESSKEQSTDDIISGIMNDLNEASNQNSSKQEKSNQFKKIKSKIKSVRKSMPQLLKKIIKGAALIGTVLVLMAAGLKSKLKSVEPKPPVSSNIDVGGTEDIPESDISSTITDDNVPPVPDNLFTSEYGDDDFTITSADGQDLSNLGVIPAEPITAENDYGYADGEIHMGSEVYVDGSIHRDVYNARDKEHNLKPYYDAEQKRVVIGMGIMLEGKMNVIYASDENANVKMNDLLDKGGEVVSILTANKEKYLQDYNGNETLLPEEIKAYAEGWYNIEDVTMDNVKGVSR